MQNSLLIPNKKFSLVEARLSGAFATRFLLELFGNTSHFPIANILFELLAEGSAYLRMPDVYILLVAALTQTYFLTRWQKTPRSRRFWGNLIAPALYTVIETLLEGWDFFSSPNHLAYWGIALTIGALQAVSPRLPRRLAQVTLLLENVIHVNIVFLMYALFETHANPTQAASLGAFFADSSHQFIALSTLILGLSAGLGSLTSQHYLNLLQQTSAQLNIYSEWLLGRDLLNRIITDSKALALTRQERTILFMDIRNFTGWSDSHSPEQVATLLNQYYGLAEGICANYRPIKLKFSADELLAVYATAGHAVDAAIQLRRQINQKLAEQNLGVGIGLHAGVVMEGLLGSSAVKFYDVIGDVVNVAKRIESSAQGGEILISDSVQLASHQDILPGAKREITVKGKPEPLTVYPIEQATEAGGLAQTHA